MFELEVCNLKLIIIYKILTGICNNRKQKDKTYVQLTTVPNPGFLICCSISLGLMACIPLATAPDWTKIGAKIGNEID